MVERKILYTNVPKNKKGYIWNKSIGCYIDFIYGDYSGRIEITDRIKPNKLKIKYQNKEKIIDQKRLLLLQIGDLLGFINRNFKYNIGYVFGKNNTKMKITSRYKSNSKKMYHAKCIRCHYEKDTSEESIDRNEGCPVCDNKIVVRGINDMWTTNPQLASLLKNSSDGYNCTEGSKTKLIWICPNCNNHTKPLSPNYVGRYGLRCSACGDGFSFPEKLMSNILKQLNISFNHGQRFEWSNNRIYDFYLPEYNCIIETHGMQHYEECHLGTRTLKEEQENDRYKEQIAKRNGIENYIVIDCRYSQFDYIYKNIISSKLNYLFDLSLVDIRSATELSETNMFLEAAKLYNKMNGNVCKLKEILDISNTTLNRYLNRANDLGLIIYDKSKSAILGNKKSQERRYQNNAKPIMCIENGYVFGSCSIASNKSLEAFGVKISSGEISLAVNYNKPTHNLNFKYISRLDFNTIKRDTPNISYGDYFEKENVA